MKAELIDKWLEALRSGKYTQVKNVLKKALITENGCKAGHCVLGVLLEEAKDELPEGVIFCDTAIAVPHEHLTHDMDYEQYLSNTMLNTECRRALGISDNFCQTLIEFNDKQGVNFKNIANYIDLNREMITR